MGAFQIMLKQNIVIEAGQAEDVVYLIQNCWKLIGYHLEPFFIKKCIRKITTFIFVTNFRMQPSDLKEKLFEVKNRLKNILQPYSRDYRKHDMQIRDLDKSLEQEGQNDIQIGLKVQVKRDLQLKNARLQTIIDQLKPCIKELQQKIANWGDKYQRVTGQTLYQQAEQLYERYKLPPMGQNNNAPDPMAQNNNKATNQQTSWALIISGGILLVCAIFGIGLKIKRLKK